MRRIFLFVALCVSLAFCDTVITVGATPVPHAQILEFIKPMLKKEGYDLKIRVFNDYIIPNKAVENGELDANYYQHLPYLKEFNLKNHTHLVPTVGVHIEPMCVYSKKIKNLNELKDNDSVSIPNDPTNESRALMLLQKAGLIKLDNSKGLLTPKDIVSNPKHLKIIELEAAQLPRTLADTTISVINTNYAINAGLNPLKDSLFTEDKNSPYVNYIVVKAGNQNEKKIKALDKAITSKAVREFILNKYHGAIVPAF